MQDNNQNNNQNNNPNNTPNGNRNNNPNKRKFNNKKKKSYLDESYVPPYPAQTLGQSVGTLKLSDAVETKLVGAGLNTIYDIVRREDKDFYRIPTFDKRNLGELKNALNAKRLRLKPPAVQESKPSSTEGEAKAPRKEVAKKERVAPNNAEGKEQPNKGNNRVNNRENKNEKKQKQSPKDNKRIWNPDGISEKRTKEERAKLRPKRVEIPTPVDKYVKINKNGKWGFATRDGKEVITPEYDDVFMFKDELCCVEKDAHFGFIDRQGNVVIPIIYDTAVSFSEGYACVYKGENCGYIDKENNVVVPFIYDAGTYVTDGGCRVKRLGKWGELKISDPDEVRWII